MTNLVIVLAWLAGGYLARRALGLDQRFDAARRGGVQCLFAESYVSAVPVGRPFPLSNIGAAWGVWVLVTPDEVWVWPMAGFRPSFIGRVCGVERCFSRQDVQVLGVEPSLLGRKAVTISGKTPRGKTVRLRLYLYRAGDFLKALTAERTVEAPPVLSEHRVSD